MPILLYTNEAFQVGSTVDTRDYCKLNEAVLDAADPAVRGVELLLEEIRAEHFPDAPDRLCSVLGVPIPKKTGNVRRLDYEGWFTEIPTPEPPGPGVRCYHIAEGSGTRRLLADESIVQDLVRKWDRLKDKWDRWEIATGYWSGTVLKGYSLLLQGPIRIVAECSEQRQSQP